MAQLLVIVVAFAVTAALMPLLIRISLRLGCTDKPGPLKVHAAPVPVFGGIGIFAGVVAALALDAGAGAAKVAAVLAIALALVVLGTADDLLGLSPRARLAAQLLVAVATMAAGLKVGTFPLLAAMPLTVVLVVGAINAVNLFDGLDGLAGGTVAVSLVGFAALLHLSGKSEYVLLALAVLGALVGFLLFNFNPARIFMGDNGSTFLGYVLAVLAMNVAARPWDLRSLAVALLLIGLPIVDTAVAIGRRALEGRPIFLGDRSHIYDQLVDHGFSVRQTAFICYGIQAALVSGSVWLAAYP